MGSPMNIIFYAADSLKAEHIAKQCFLLADSLNAIFSDYSPESELNKLSATAGKDSFVQVSHSLYDVLILSRTAWQKSDHSFDITVGPLTHLWRIARKSKKFPGAGEVQEAKLKVGFDKLAIDTVNHRVKLIQKHMQLDLGGIAKGYAAQKIIDFLLSQHIRQALVDAGGDMVMTNAPPGSGGWHVGINTPRTHNELLSGYLRVTNKAVATSGDFYQYMEHGGQRYSHIIDPKTGYGVTFQRNVTVIADDGATADWLASACSIVSLKKAKKIARQYNAALLITTIDKGKIKIYKAGNFDSYWARSDSSN